MSPICNNSFSVAATAASAQRNWRAANQQPRLLKRGSKGPLNETTSVEVSRDLAKMYDLSAHLGYIPMAARWSCRWLDAGTFYSPVYGRLKWVGREDERPDTAEKLQRTKMFVCRMCVASSVCEVVVKSGWEVWKNADRVYQNKEGKWWIEHELVQEWVKEAKGEWEEKVNVRYRGLLGGISPEEMWALVNERNITKDQFEKWCDQRAWDCGNCELEKDMKSLEGREDARPEVTAKEWEDWRESAWGSWEEDPRTNAEEGETVHYDPTPTLDLRAQDMRTIYSLLDVIIFFFLI